MRLLAFIILLFNSICVCSQEFTYESEELKIGQKMTLPALDYSTSRLASSSNKKILDSFAYFLKGNKSISVNIITYTDQRGSSEYNQRLSLGKSEKIKKHLLSCGIDSTRLIAIGMGESNPIIEEEFIFQMRTEEEKEDAYMKNRRTIIEISKFTYNQSRHISCEIEKWKKEYRKAKNIVLKADKALQIADCLRENNDMINKEWYNKVISTYRENIVYDGPYMPELTYHVALSYYWLSDSLFTDQSEVWLEKAILAMNNGEFSKVQCEINEEMLYYYLGITQHRGKRYHKALKYFNTFKLMKGDTLQVNSLIKDCIINTEK